MDNLEREIRSLFRSKIFQICRCWALKICPLNRDVLYSGVSILEVLQCHLKTIEEEYVIITGLSKFYESLKIIYKRL